MEPYVARCVALLVCGVAIRLAFTRAKEDIYMERPTQARHPAIHFEVFHDH